MKINSSQLKFEKINDSQVVPVPVVISMLGV